MSQPLINALLFILLLGTLVTVHELGHFLVAKAFGIKVLRFSVGFGPKLLGFTWGETEYWISALPLGGYVKMAGDAPGEEMAPGDAGRGFLEQAPWKRALVALAGPAMNLAFPLVVFFFAYSMTTQDYVPLLATVFPGQPAYEAGLRPGDRVVAIQDVPVERFTQLQKLISRRPGMPTKVAYVRGDRRFETTMTPVAHEERTLLGKETKGMIGVSLSARSPVIGVTGPDTPAARAGLRTFDRVVKVAGVPVDSYPVMVRELAKAVPEADAAHPLRLSVARDRVVGEAAGILTLWDVFEVDVVPDPSRLQALEAARRSGDQEAALLSDGEALLGIESSEMYLFSVEFGSPAEAAGLRRGDRVRTISGKPALSFMGFSQERVRIEEGDVAVGYRRDGVDGGCVVAQKKLLKEDAYGNKHEVLRFGAFGDMRPSSYADIEKITYKPTLSEAASRALEKVPQVISQTFMGIWKVFFDSRISARGIGGPIAIYHVASKTAEEGAEVFLRFMGFISINLGLANLLPIPILDGFHILSAAVEAIRRKPMDEKVQVILSYLGLACLLALMLLAFRNDFLNFILK